MAIKKKAGATLNQVKKPRAPISWAKVMKQGFSLLAILVIVASGMFFELQDAYPIKHVTVAGTMIHSDKQSLVASVSPYVKGNFFNIDVESVRRAGEQLPWVKQVQVRRVWPDTLHLIVEEQTAIALWNQQGLVNKLGEVFYPPQNTIPEGLVQINGPEGMSLFMAHRLAEIQHSFTGLDLTISKMTIDERRALKIEFNHELHVNLGRADSDERLKRFKTVFQGGLSEFRAMIAEIDMRYTNGLAVVWKEGQQPDFNGTV